MKRLIEREIRGLIRTPGFVMLILCIFPVITIPSVGQASRNIVTTIITVLPPLHLLQDSKTGEIDWLFLLPVNRITIFSAKYIAGLVVVELFIAIFSLISILIHGAPWGFWPFRAAMLGLSYSAAFFAAYVVMRLI